MSALWLLACAGGPTGTTAPVDSDPVPVTETDDSAPPTDTAPTETGDTGQEWARLTDAQLLTRLSLDLRGTRPTLAELDRVAADPAELDVLVDEFLDDERFADRRLPIFDAITHTDTRSFWVNFGDLFGEGWDSDFTREVPISVGQEPLRLIRQVIVEDRPWTEVVTADWTMADHHLARIYPVDYPDGATGWHPVTWTDARPPGGLLVSSGFYQRYISQGVNYQRRRANELSRILLCQDYRGRTIEFSRESGISDAESTQAATQESEACIGCHNSLDPLASHLWGFDWYAYGLLDQLAYHPSKELDWQDTTGVAPAYYGQDSQGLQDLGHLIAGDSRFPNCVVTQVMATLLQEPVLTEDLDRYNHHREAFLASDLRVKALFRSVLADPMYVAAIDNPDARSSARLITADMLRTSVEDLTGFRLEYDVQGEGPILDLPDWRVIGGGTDGLEVLSATASVHMPLALLHARISEVSAMDVALRELAVEAGERSLFTEVEADQSPATHPDQAAAQVQRLLRRVLAEEAAADSARVAELLALWEAAWLAEGSNWQLADEAERRAAAWAAVLAAILRDPTFLVY